MKIHLLRHADAENFLTTDAARRLTEKGQVQAEIVGDFFVRTREPLDIILTSPYLRALQTAQAISRRFNDVPLMQEPRLACGLSPETGLNIIQEYQKLGNILIVGHQPDLSLLAAALLSKDQSFNIEFKKATLLTLVFEKLSFGTAEIDSYIHVKQM